MLGRTRRPPPPKKQKQIRANVPPTKRRAAVGAGMTCIITPTESTASASFCAEGAAAVLTEGLAGDGYQVSGGARGRAGRCGAACIAPEGCTPCRGRNGRQRAPRQAARVGCPCPGCAQRVLTM